MMIKFSDGNRDRVQLSPGNYTAQLIKVEHHPTEEETAQGVIPQFGPYLTFVFKTIEPVANGFVSGICSAKRHPKSKLTSWLAALGVNINEVGENLDEASLRGRQVKLRVEQGANDRLKITAMASVNALVAVPTSAPLGFKSAPKAQAPRPATPSYQPPVQKVAAPVNPPATPFTSTDLDDVPF